MLQSPSANLGCWRPRVMKERPHQQDFSTMKYTQLPPSHKLSSRPSGGVGRLPRVSAMLHAPGSTLNKSPAPPAAPGHLCCWKHEHYFHGVCQFPCVKLGIFSWTLQGRVFNLWDSDYWTDNISNNELSMQHKQQQGIPHLLVSSHAGWCCKRHRKGPRKATTYHKKMANCEKPALQGYLPRHSFSRDT